MENTNPVPKTIVLADNEPLITHAYKSGLESAGYLVTVAPDGGQALEQIRSIRPDVVLLELMLPDIDGFTIIKTIKADAELSAIPVIVLTNLSQESDKTEAMAAGAADFLVKDEVSLNDVLMRLERLFAS